MAKRVAIIGAGISGLLACKYALSIGLDPVVFEAESYVGGLWNHTIECTRLQSHKDYFQFSDFPWPNSIKSNYPKNEQVLEYVNSYADHFNLFQYIHFNSRVTSISYEGESKDEMAKWTSWGGAGTAFGSQGKWRLQVHVQPSGDFQFHDADFVIVCIGKFSGLPSVPEFPPGRGPEVFSGKVLHSMDYSDMDNGSAAEFIKGKRVAVIGSGKSAIDIAYECGRANGSEIPCTVIHRNAHWMLPYDLPWVVAFGLLCFTRFSEMMVHKPGETFFATILATLLLPLRWLMSKILEISLQWKLPLKKYDMIPKENFLEEANSCQVIMLQDNFFDWVVNESIVFKKIENFSFCKEGLIVDGEDKTIEVDIVIFATGYKGDEKLKSIFASHTFQNNIFGLPNSTVPLYRQMINPRIPRLAVVGYSESLSNLYTFEMRCRWLAFFLSGAFPLPSIKEMEDDIRMWERYMKKYAGNGEFKRGCIAGIHIWYNDQLCRDIGCNPMRKSGILAELFEPYGMADYDGITPARWMKSSYFNK
nr:FMO [Acanthus ilicifolius]